MEIFSMICFVTLARCKKFSEAAELLYLSQSAFSKQIQAIENVLGTKLFIRNAWATELTEAGQAVLPYMQSITTEYEKAKNSLSKYRRDSQNRLAISTFSFLVHYKLSDMIFSFRALHPEISLVLMEADTNHSIYLLDANQIDACIVFSKEGAFPEYDVHPLLSDKLVVYLGPQHSFSNRDFIRLSELQNESIQMLHESQEPFLHALLLDQFKKAGFTPNVSPYGLWIDSIEDIMQNENRISLLPQKLAEYSRNPDLRLIPVEDADDLQLSLVTRKGFSSASLDVFVEYIYSYIRDRLQ